MYNIEKKDYGYKMTFSGSLTKEEMAEWLEKIEKILPGEQESFAILMDIRKLQPVSQVVQKFFRRGQMLLEKQGMVRSAIVFDSPAIVMQFKRLAIQSEIFDKERYIDTSSTLQWEDASNGWVTESIEPTIYTGQIAKKF
ncbi:MAG: hypothetical protein U9N55_02775 [candidate division Zixibacteria bacterium]|nr:hypothetical protein [candidate division Zixibacteria bacterium]